MNANPTIAPQWLASHPNATDHGFEGMEVTSISLLMCQSCRIPLNACHCGNPNRAKGVVWSHKNGFNQEFIDVLSKLSPVKLSVPDDVAPTMPVDLGVTVPSENDNFDDVFGDVFAKEPSASSPVGSKASDASEKPLPESVQAATAISVPEVKSMLAHALDCIRRGWFVVPCYPRTKVVAGNAVPHGVKEASNDEAVIRTWWEKNPDYNPAIALGPSNLVVYDFDTIKPFENIPATFTVKTGRIEKDGIAGIQLYYGGSCTTHGHANGGGEVRSRGAYVMAPGAVHPSGNPYLIIDDRPLAPSPEQNEEKKSVEPAIDNADQMTIAGYVEAGFDVSGIDYQAKVQHEGGFKWFIACPWKEEHTTGNDFDTSSAVIMWPSGKLIYECKHSHCQGKRQWKELRLWMESKVGNFLVFGDPSTGDVLLNGKVLNAPVETIAAVEPPDENSEAAIPSFDPSVINGIYAKFVELVCRGTTLAPQFAYVIAKTIVGARMAGKVKFENLDVEPRYYTALIGETGSGKSEAWRRTLQILQPEHSLVGCKIKIINSADSGAGIKDCFFQQPEEQPVLCYVDEIEGLGNKSKDTRNPGILDTMIELADSTCISRVLAKREGGGTKSKRDARFSMVMCGQDGSVYMKALAGRTKLGLWDRFYPEYSVAQEAGDLPPVDIRDAIELLSELNSLDYSGTMNMSQEAKSRLEIFWAGQPREVKTKVRWKKNIALDAYMSAFGRGVRVAELADMDIAIRIFTRQTVIRRVSFTTEVPDRIGYYLGLIKRITKRMEQRIAAGMPADEVAKSRRDYEKETHAHRDNEEHIFSKAWETHWRVHLTEVTIKKTNGQTYKKYLPMSEG